MTSNKKIDHKKVDALFEVWVEDCTCDLLLVPLEGFENEWVLGRVDDLVLYLQSVHFNTEFYFKL